MADVNKTVAVLFQAQDQMTSALAQVNKALDDLQGEAGQAATELDKADKELDQIGGTASTVAGLLKTAFGAFTVVEVVRSFIEANTAVERFQLAVTQISGSAELAGTEFEYLQGVANTLGLSVRDASDAYIGLLAATKNTALEGQAARDIFEAVSTAMAKLGRSSADTEGALLAIQQIVSKGTVSAEELRGQLGERLPGAFQIAARAVGVTTEELGKMLEQGQVIAADFLPKFADELQKTFGETTFVDSYTASMNRLRNAWDEFLVTLGKAGAFNAVSGGLDQGTKLLTAFAGGFEYLKEVGVATFNVLSGESIETFAIRLDLAGKKATEVSDKLNNAGGLNESLAETARLIRQNAELADGGWFDDEFEAETKRLQAANNAAAESLTTVSDALKILGVNINDTKDGADKFAQAFADLANNPDVRGDQILSGFEAAIKRIKDEDALSSVIEELAGAFARGQISASEFNAALGKAQDAQLKLDEASGGATSALIAQEKELAKTAESARKAEEAAQKYAIEIEKIASNERIKTIEASVELDIARFESNVELVKAGLASIDTTIQSTGELLGDLFGLLANPDTTFSQQFAIEDQIELENQRREKALKLQEEYTNAIVENLRAQTQSLQRGDALIQVDGAGLQPHLEAFMWEILRTIQVRVNREGLGLLLGV